MNSFFLLGRRGEKKKKVKKRLDRKKWRHRDSGPSCILTHKKEKKNTGEPVHYLAEKKRKGRERSRTITRGSRKKKKKRKCVRVSYVSSMERKKKRERKGQNAQKGKKKGLFTISICVLKKRKKNPHIFPKKRKGGMNFAGEKRKGPRPPKKRRKGPLFLLRKKKKQKGVRRGRFPPVLRRDERRVFCPPLTWERGKEEKSRGGGEKKEFGPKTGEDAEKGGNDPHTFLFRERKGGRGSMFRRRGHFLRQGKNAQGNTPEGGRNILARPGSFFPLLGRKKRRGGGEIRKDRPVPLIPMISPPPFLN